MLHVGKVYGIYGTSFEKIKVGCSINASNFMVEVAARISPGHCQESVQMWFLDSSLESPSFREDSSSNKSTKCRNKKKRTSRWAPTSCRLFFFRPYKWPEIHGQLWVYSYNHTFIGVISPQLMSWHSTCSWCRIPPVPTVWWCGKKCSGPIHRIAIQFKWQLQNEVSINTRWWFQICCIFIPYLGKWSNLTNTFQMSWIHQLEQYQVLLFWYDWFL